MSGGKQARIRQVPRTSHFSSPATLVIGLGNPLRGDDGLGVSVGQAMSGRIPPGVDVVDGGTPGLGLVNLMEGRRKVVLIDAADVGKPPGEFVRFTLDEASLLGDEPGSAQPVSLHAAGVRDAVLLAQALDLLPEEVVIFGVQPANLEWESSLSSQVKAALPDLIAAVLAEVAPQEGDEHG